MLQNAYLLAKIGADTAENEQHFAEILSKIGNYLTGLRGRAAEAALAEAPRAWGVEHSRNLMYVRVCGWGLSAGIIE